MTSTTIPETSAPPRPLVLDAAGSPVVAGAATLATAPGRPPGRLGRLVRGPATEPGWARPGLLALLVLTAVLYLWDLSASGYANSFYAAAVQAGTQSWKAMFFGSLDASNAITVDKPAFFLWPMEIAGRIFGFTSWSMLVPQALEGVAAVGLLAATVRRAAGPAAGLIAGAALALTPAAVLIFRFNNPDAMLVLLLVAAGYCVMRAIEAASTRWVTLAGVLVGLGFITKMGQALLMVPALALTYLIAAPTSLRRRLTDLLGAGVAMVAGAGWWIAIVQLWPASSRPYIGGSTNNSVLELAFGYNGLGRLFSGSSTGGGGGGSTAAAGSSFGGATGLSRLFSSEMGNEISWLLPAALVALAGGLWVTRRAPRTDHARALLILFGGWLLVTGLTFSFMQGTIHPYYTVALAPAIAGVLAVGSRALWIRRSGLTARIGLAAVVAAAGAWSFVLLDRTSSWYPELRFIVAGLSILAVVGLLVPLGRLRKASRAALVAGVLAGGVLAGGLGTGAFAVATAAVPHTGSIPSVGPAAASTATGGGMGGGFGGGTGGGTPPTGTGTRTGTPPTRPTGTGTGSTTGNSTGTAAGTGSATGSSASTSIALVTALKSSTTTWSAAVVGDQTAAELELSSGTAVMAIGGWSGSDASPTLAQFKADVAAGKIHYLISGTGMGGGQGGSTGTASQITAWVKAHYKATTIGGQTVYDLTAAATS